MDALSRAQQHLKRASQLKFESQNETKKANAFGNNVKLNDLLYIKTTKGHVYAIRLEKEINPPDNPLLCIQKQQFHGTIEHYFENERESIMVVVDRNDQKQKVKRGTDVQLVVQTDSLCLYTDTDMYSIIAFGVKIATGTQVTPEIKERADVFTTNLKVTANASETLNGSEPFNIMVHQLHDLPQMQFFLTHEKSGETETFQELDFAQAALMKWPRAARYYVIRRVWLFCTAESCKFNFPMTIAFRAFWKGKLFLAINAFRTTPTLRDGDDQLAYSLNAIICRTNEIIGHVSSLNQDTSQKVHQAKCDMHACVWQDKKKYNENVIDKLVSVDRNSSGVQRSFRMDGCSYEAISQVEDSCWFVSVATLLTKIEPVYIDFKKVDGLRRWLEYDRSNLTNSQASCNENILPARLRQIYRSFANESLEDFDFSGTKKSTYGGAAFDLLRAAFLYFKECRDSADTKRSKADAAKYIIEFLKAGNAKDIANWRTTDDSKFSLVINSNFHFVESPSSVFHAIKQHKNVLGGILALKNRTGTHSIVFTMCDGKPIVCSWGKCHKDRSTDGTVDVLVDLQLDGFSSAYDIALIFAPVGIEQPKPQRKKTEILLVLRNPMNTLHLHVNIDLTQKIHCTSDHFIFHGNIQHIEHEFERTNKTIAGLIPEIKELVGEDVQCYGNAHGSTYKRSNWEMQYMLNPSKIQFVSEQLDSRGERVNVKHYVGDIPGPVLKNFFMRKQKTL